MKVETSVPIVDLIEAIVSNGILDTSDIDKIFPDKRDRIDLTVDIDEDDVIAKFKSSALAEIITDRGDYTIEGEDIEDGARLIEGIEALARGDRPMALTLLHSAFADGPARLRVETALYRAGRKAAA